MSKEKIIADARKALLDVYGANPAVADVRSKKAAGQGRDMNGKFEKPASTDPEDNLTPQEKLSRLFKKVRKNLIHFSKYLQIKTKAGDITQLVLNSSQAKLYKKIQELQAAGIPVRIIILKPRQIGFSTLIEALIYMETALFRGISSLIIGHKPVSTKQLFKMFERFYRHAPPWAKPAKEFSNRQELTWKELEGGIECLTAHDDDSRSLTIQKAHFSEVAFWGANADNLMNAAKNMVPKLPGTMIFIESTANGVGNFFHREYFRAKAGQSNYIAWFVAWFEHEEYRIDSATWESLGLLDEDEEWLIKNYNVDAQQLAWRRDTIDDECNGSLDKFHQEYPATDEEAFLSSGACPFDTRILSTMDKELKDKKNYKSYSIRPLDLRTMKLADWLEDCAYEDRKGSLRIYEEPEITHKYQYAMAADPAEGLAQSDNSVLEVGNRLTQKQVAEYSGKCAPDTLADISVYLAFKYGKCLICPEVNNHGHAYLVRMKELNYWNIYHREETDKAVNKKKKIMGFRTTTITKPLLIDRLAKWIRDGGMLASYEAVQEFLSFIHEGNKFEAESGCLDDKVMGMGLLIRAFEDLPVMQRIEEAGIHRVPDFRDKQAVSAAPDIFSY